MGVTTVNNATNVQRDSKRQTQFRTSHFLNYKRYVNELHNIWKRRSHIFNFQSLERSPSAQLCSSVSWEQNGYYAAQEFLRSWVHWNRVANCRAARGSSSFQHSISEESICRWNRQFEQIGCLCKGKGSGRPRVSEENVRRIQESFERSPRKWTRRASRELGIPQPTV